MSAEENDTWGAPATAVPDADGGHLYSVLPVLVLYALIFALGLVGNVSTCVVIARNKHMHTATNYYLFSLAVSDLLLLVSGLPQEMYYMWYKTSYADSDALCVLQGLAAETSANATVLTITAFTVERYVAICHPFQSHVVSKLSRAVKFVVGIWALALLLAAPQALQLRLVRSGGARACNIAQTLLQHAFLISTCVFFLAPMTAITVLYALIGLRLRRSRVLAPRAPPKTTTTMPSAGGERRASAPDRPGGQGYVIRMLVAVVAAFFICWAPFHAQRLLAVYANSVKAEEKRKSLDQVYTVLTYLSGIFYYLSTTVNPVLYNIMSHKFREAFKSTLAQCCGRDKYSKRKRAYSVLSRCNNNHQQQHQPLCRAHPDWQPPRSPPGAAGGGGLPAAGAAAAPSSPAAAAAAAAGSLNHSYPQYRPRSRVSSDSSQLTLTTSVGLLSLASSTRRERGGCSLLRSYPSIGALARLLRGGAEPDQGRRAAAAAAAADSTTNTISNSSLQDLDEAEFVGADLASYMGEVNELVALH